MMCAGLNDHLNLFSPLPFLNSTPDDCLPTVQFKDNLGTPIGICNVNAGFEPALPSDSNLTR